MTRRPQRIAYLLQMADLTTENGIAKKIRDQVVAWQQEGSTVRIFSLAPTLNRWIGFEGFDLVLLRRGGPVTRMWHSRELCRQIRAWNPEVIYFRYAYHSPGLPALFRRIPTVAEVNSDDTTEYALTLGLGKRLYHKLTRSRLLRTIAGFVPVTRELAVRLAKFEKPVAVIGNGIALAEFCPVPASNSSGAHRLVFVGSAGSPWHGLERIRELAGLFPEYCIDIIGCTAADLREAVGPSAPSPQADNLVFHGNLDRIHYEPLLAAATAALGTFGLYRKSMDEACPLKVREYLALGLPVIGACLDTDIPENADYYLRLPNSSESLQPHAAAIAAFLERWRGRRVPRASIAHLDSKLKENERLKFMGRISNRQEEFP